MKSRFVILMLAVMCTTVRGELKLLQHWPVGNNACVDTPLRLTFDGPPVFAREGSIEIRRASDRTVVKTIDLKAEKFTDRFGNSETGAALVYEPVWIERVYALYNAPPGTVQKIIKPPHPDLPEKAEIAVEGADELYKEIRIENTLTDEKGNEVKLKPGATVEVTVEAEPKDTVKKDAKANGNGKH